MAKRTDQMDMFEVEAVRSSLDQLLIDSQLYTQSSNFKELLDFVVKLRNFAPFNAMLLHIQKPGLSYAASAHDWHAKFGRFPKYGARPLLILWPFGPVAFVYDVMDTEGKPLPTDVSSFMARGCIDNRQMDRCVALMTRENIEIRLIDSGDLAAGSIKVVSRPVTDKETTHYCVHLNSNHSVAVQFSTITHELAHLFLGHLGLDSKLNAPDRGHISKALQEFEAESVAYIVCERSGIKLRSETYLVNHVTPKTTLDDIDLYQVMRAAGQVESLLGLSMPTKFGVSGTANHRRNSKNG